MTNTQFETEFENNLIYETIRHNALVVKFLF